MIGRKPIHLLKDDDRKKAPELKDLHIDIGANRRRGRAKLVRIGDVAVIDVNPVEMPNGRLVSRALDNRVGCYVAAEAARLGGRGGGAPGDVVALAVVQEETSLAGARTSAFALEPDVAIAVDVTFATDQPGIELGPITKHTLGSGPVVARGTLIHPRSSSSSTRPVNGTTSRSPSSRSVRVSGTDADAIHAAAGVCRPGWSPCRFATCTRRSSSFSSTDIEATAKLIAAFAQRLEPGMSFQR